MSITSLKWTLSAALLLTANVEGQNLTPEKISVDAKLVAQITPHLASERTKPIPSFLVTYSVVAKGNFGRSIKSSESVERRQIDDGLYEVRGHRSDPNGTTGNGTALSLCGIANVLAVSESRDVITGYSLASGVAIEMRYSSDSASSSHLLRFESSAPSICNLSPGTNFSYLIDGVTTLNLKRSILRDKKLEVLNSSETHCTTSLSTSPSSEISELLSGDYLDVSCVTTNRKNKNDSMTVALAYLIDYHYYIPLNTITSASHSEIKYSAPNLTTQ